MIKIQIFCDFCKYVENANEPIREWITLSSEKEELHFCCNKCLKNFLAGKEEKNNESKS